MAHIFLCTFITFTFAIMVYLTIVLFIVFSPTLILLQIYAETINSNICSAPFYFFKLHNTISQLFKVQFVLRKLFHKTHGYCIDRICCCECTFVRWVEDVFNTFKSTDINVTSFHTLFVMCIHSFFPLRCTQIIFLALIIVCTKSLFILVLFNVAHTH